MRKVVNILALLIWVSSIGQTKFKQDILSSVELGGLMKTVSFKQSVILTDSTIVYKVIDKKQLKRLKVLNEPTSITIHLTFLKRYVDDYGNRVLEYLNKNSNNIRILVVKRPDGTYCTVYNIINKETESVTFFQTDMLQTKNVQISTK